MNPKRRLSLIWVVGLLLAGCATTRTVDLNYIPGKVSPVLKEKITVAIIPFEDTTWNGQDNPYYVGKASLYGIELLSPYTISQTATRGIKKEMEAYGYELSPDEIYTIQISRKDIKTLLKKIPYTQVDYLIGGTVSHFFIHQKVRFVADVEIEAFLIRPPGGEVIWSKKIGHREERIPFTPETFPAESQNILNNLLDKTLKDLFRNSDFRLHTLKDKRP